MARLALALCLLAPTGAGAEHAESCPAGSRPMRTVDQREPWACALTDEKYRDGMDCPSGTHAVVGGDALSPFKCALNDVALIPPRETAEPRRFGPSCPKGTRPVPTPGKLTPFRCLAETSPASVVPGPGGRCPAGTRKVLGENPFSPVRCVRARKNEEARGYSLYTLSGEASFLYPSSWKVSDAWKEAVPSLYILRDSPAEGPQASLLVSRQRKDSPEYEPLEVVVAKEKRWRSAREEEGLAVAGLPTLHIGVGGESKSAFVRTEDGYFILSYSAPGELFERWLPAYRRLLTSFAVAARRPAARSRR